MEMGVAMQPENPQSGVKRRNVKLNINQLDYEKVVREVCAQNAQDLYEQLVARVDLLNKKHTEASYKRTVRKAYKNALCGSFEEHDRALQRFNKKEEHIIQSITSRDVSIGVGGIAVGALGLWVCQKLRSSPKYKPSKIAAREQEKALELLLRHGE